MLEHFTIEKFSEDLNWHGFGLNYKYPEVAIVIENKNCFFIDKECNASSISLANLGASISNYYFPVFGEKKGYFYFLYNDGGYENKSVLYGINPKTKTNVFAKSVISNPTCVTKINYSNKKGIVYAPPYTFDSHGNNETLFQDNFLNSRYGLLNDIDGYFYNGDTNNMYIRDRDTGEIIVQKSNVPGERTVQALSCSKRKVIFVGESSNKYNVRIYDNNLNLLNTLSIKGSYGDILVNVVNCVFDKDDDNIVYMILNQYGTTSSYHGILLYKFNLTNDGTVVAPAITQNLGPKLINKGSYHDNYIPQSACIGQISKDSLFFLASSRYRYFYAICDKNLVITKNTLNYAYQVGGSSYAATAATAYNSYLK